LSGSAGRSAMAQVRLNDGSVASDEVA